MAAGSPDERRNQVESVPCLSRGGIIGAYDRLSELPVIMKADRRSISLKLAIYNPAAFITDFLRALDCEETTKVTGPCARINAGTDV
jgi:hypothetical protein